VIEAAGRLAHTTRAALAGLKKKAAPFEPHIEAPTTGVAKGAFACASKQCWRGTH